jgi:hypothetical protein
MSASDIVVAGLTAVLKARPNPWISWVRPLASLDYIFACDTTVAPSSLRCDDNEFVSPLSSLSFVRQTDMAHASKSVWVSGSVVKCGREVSMRLPRTRPKLLRMIREQ